MARSRDKNSMPKPDHSDPNNVLSDLFAELLTGSGRNSDNDDDDTEEGDDD